tara:strand:+ start:22200 stop:22970 length:771 start_codon:yes stop_codon:yes gene_type:complete
MRILITGGGYVGSSLYNALRNEYRVNLVTRKDFDLTSFTDLQKFLKGKYFDAVIHTAVSGGSRLREDTGSEMDNNLTMYYNILQHKDHYGKLIHFGSGAEEHTPETPYGISKRVIAKSILEQDKFYNIKVFGVFDENELDTRFIKANLKRYINREPMIINASKRMTFFYMKDLITLVKHYIDTRATALRKESHCAYTTDYSLKEIADMINELDDYKVQIYKTEEVAEDYISNYNAGYGLTYTGFKKGLYETYNKLR